MNRREAARLAFAAVVVALAVIASCRAKTKSKRAASSAPKDPSLTLVTGYCNCGKCCDWRRSWFGFGAPVHARGPMKGKPKRVGVTARGTTAKRGTIAADVKSFPFGTRLVVPGYGTGTVEDVGAAIRGRHIDVWFPTHAEAMRWGKRWLKVTRLAPAANSVPKTTAATNVVSKSASSVATNHEPRTTNCESIVTNSVDEIVSPTSRGE